MIGETRVQIVWKAGNADCDMYRGVTRGRTGVG